MSIPKPGSLIFLQDYQTTQQNGSTNYCSGTGSCNTSPKQRQHNAPSEKVEPFTWGAKRMDTVNPSCANTKRELILARRNVVELKMVAPVTLLGAWS